MNKIIFTILFLFLIQVNTKDPIIPFIETSSYGRGTLPIEFVYKPFLFNFSYAVKEAMIQKELITGLVTVERFRPVWDVYKRNTINPVVKKFENQGWKFYCYSTKCDSSNDLNFLYIKRLQNEKCLWRQSPVTWVEFVINSTLQNKDKKNNCYKNPSDACFIEALKQIDDLSPDITIEKIENCILAAQYDLDLPKESEPMPYYNRHNSLLDEELNIFDGFNKKIYYVTHQKRNWYNFYVQTRLRIPVEQSKSTGIDICEDFNFTQEICTYWRDNYNGNVSTEEIVYICIWITVQIVVSVILSIVCCKNKYQQVNKYDPAEHDCFCDNINIKSERFITAKGKACLKDTQEINKLLTKQNLESLNEIDRRKTQHY